MNNLLSQTSVGRKVRTCYPHESCKVPEPPVPPLCQNTLALVNFLQLRLQTGPHRAKCPVIQGK